MPLDATIPGLDGPGGCPPVIENPVRQRLVLLGGGFAGRFTAAADLTKDEIAHGQDFDHEGRAGGWVLPLVPTREAHTQPRLDIDLPRPKLLSSPHGYVDHSFMKPVTADGEPVRSLQPAHSWRLTPYEHRVTRGNDDRPIVASVWDAHHW